MLRAVLVLAALDSDHTAAVDDRCGVSTETSSSSDFMTAATLSYATGNSL